MINTYNQPNKMMMMVIMMMIGMELFWYSPCKGWCCPSTRNNENNNKSSTTHHHHHHPYNHCSNSFEFFSHDVRLTFHLYILFSQNKFESIQHQSHCPFHYSTPVSVSISLYENQYMLFWYENNFFDFCTKTWTRYVVQPRKQPQVQVPVLRFRFCTKTDWPCVVRFVWHFKSCNCIVSLNNLTTLLNWFQTMK